MFEQFDIDARVLEALRSKDITAPTPVQSAALPEALAGRDVLGQARTGTGKTLAFAIPIAQRLEEDNTRGRAPRALILTPTRELALQVAGEIEWLARHLNITAVYGGTGYGTQAGALKRGTDVIVATPGRAIDYLERGILDLSAVQIAVLDEADEMLSMGFEEDVEKLLGATPDERQTMLFSATLPHWARRISEQHLKDPFVVNVVRDEEVNYEELAIEAPMGRREAVLADVLHLHGGSRSIVFAGTKAETDALARNLSAKNIAAEAIHGDLNQAQRERAVERLRSGQVRVLVGTDVAARGLDIPAVDLVVHYRLPNDSASYQHRSGRTGRAGRSGKVVIFYGPRERGPLTGLERAVKRRFERAPVPQPEQVQEAKLSALLEQVDGQDEADLKVWGDVARRWIDEGNDKAVAGVLALMLGGRPPQRSLLTSEEGWVTLQLSGRPLHTPLVVRLLKEEGVGDVGRIAEAQDGAYVDVRPAEAKRLEGKDLAGAVVARATTAPEPAAPRGPRGGGRQRGGYRGKGSRPSNRRGGFRGGYRGSRGQGR